MIRHNTDLASAEWRDELYDKATSAIGIDEAIIRSVHTNDNSLCDAAIEFKPVAEQLLSSQNPVALHAARLYYNNAQLVAFWRFFRNFIDMAIASGKLDPAFPLLTVSLDEATHQMRVEPASADEFLQGHFEPIPGSASTYKFLHEDVADDISSVSIFDSLCGRITRLSQQTSHNQKCFYRFFIDQERLQDSEIWRDHVAHWFLNTYLYPFDVTRYVSSSFDSIFFASNRIELQIWLRYMLEAQLPIYTDDVMSFLNRQTKYYASLSQKISRADNEAINHHKDYLKFDAASGLVMMSDLPVGIIEHIERTCPVDGIDSMGCPFGRSKGVEKNAISEAYGYMDTLFTFITVNSREFDMLFQHAATESCNHPAR